MLVETYEVPETLGAESQQECDEEAIRLIEELDLVGQRKLVKEHDGDQIRSPYRKMKADEEFVYGQVCPRRTKLSEYSDAPIPVRVLQVAAHAKNLFGRLEVWHAENADVKDPVLVGVNKVDELSEERFILARWGDELEPLDKLMTKACAVYRDKLTVKGREILGRVNQFIESVKSCNGTEVRSIKNPSYYD